MPGLVLEGFRDMFSHAFCCASHFVTKCFYACRNHAFFIYMRFAFIPSGAAVCAAHIRRLPKGEPSVPDKEPFISQSPASKPHFQCKA